MFYNCVGIDFVILNSETVYILRKELLVTGGDRPHSYHYYEAIYFEEERADDAGWHGNTENGQATFCCCIYIKANYKYTNFCFEFQLFGALQSRLFVPYQGPEFRKTVRDVLHISVAKHVPSFFMTSLVQTARHKIAAFTDLKTWHFNQMDQKVCYASNYPYFKPVGRFCNASLIRLCPTLKHFNMMDKTFLQIGLSTSIGLCLLTHHPHFHPIASLCLCLSV